MGAHREMGMLQKDLKIRNIVYCYLSPFEQKAFGGLFSKGFPNMLRRVYGQIFRVAPIPIIGYLIYDAGEKLHDFYDRKVPADFEKEE